MTVKVLYFASLREALGRPAEELALPAGVATVGGLRAHLAARGENWQALGEGRNVRAAVNQQHGRRRCDRGERGRSRLLPAGDGGLSRDASASFRSPASACSRPTSMWAAKLPH